MTSKTMTQEELEKLPTLEYKAEKIQKLEKELIEKNHMIAKIDKAKLEKDNKLFEKDKEIFEKEKEIYEIKKAIFEKEKDKFENDKEIKMLNEQLFFYENNNS